MYLRDGCCGQRGGVKVLEDGLWLGAQVFHQLRPQFVQGHCRYTTVKLFKLGNPFGAEQVGSTCQYLTELDEGGPQLFECQPNLDRGRHPGQVGGVFPIQRMACSRQRIGQTQTPDAVAKPMADEHPQNRVQTPQVTGCTQRFDQHRWMLGVFASRRFLK